MTSAEHNIARTIPFAHSVEGKSEAEWEPLEEHLGSVAALAARFASKFGAEAWGRLAGLWHDLGKVQPEFQGKLRGQRVHIEHAGLGAALAVAKHKWHGRPLAFAIAGHHAGLANLSAPTEADADAGSLSPLDQRLSENAPLLEKLATLLPNALVGQELPALPDHLLPPSVRRTEVEAAGRRLEFWTRMIFSCLVDADRLATAAFYARAEGTAPVHERLLYDDLCTLRDCLDRHIDQLTAKASSKVDRPINTFRSQVLEACRSAAPQQPGLFSLTVPTGGGKTLSAMSFALRHAVQHGLDRVIVVIPFTSIIEQNARVYRDALGELGGRNVLEHHSGIDEAKAKDQNEEAELRRRTAAENWDAPLIVTTTVQFFESLLSNHPSRCRKLHRIARSVIVLDEVQTLPPELLTPILDVLRELTKRYGCSIVLSTATPPALVKRNEQQEGFDAADVRPIVANPVELASHPAAQRVSLEWRIDRVTPYVELAEELADHEQVLVVVHRRPDARLLAERLPDEGRYHLSALMCPAHRLTVIDRIRQALSNKGEICRVVSTQLIEAGVDIDLPVVYRALAGLDSLAQSAGRCNREGGLGERGGRFIVFRAETDPPPGTLHKAMQSAQLMVQYYGSALDPFNPEHCEAFFRELYGKYTGDERHVQRERTSQNFANVARLFRLIDNAGRPLVVPWNDEAKQRIDRFRDWPDRSTARALQPFIVQVHPHYYRQLEDMMIIETWGGYLGLPGALFGGRYSEAFGLDVDPTTGYDPDPLIA